MNPEVWGIIPSNELGQELCHSIATPGAPCYTPANPSTRTIILRRPANSLKLTLLDTTITLADCRAALPDRNGSMSLKGLCGPVRVHRDHLGIPHLRASNQRDAWLAQGFVTAQDRLWQMEYDRRRGSGRWAEVVGPQAVGEDKLMRRFRLEASARADYLASNPSTREMLDAYAQGVNAFIQSNQPLPVEYQITDLSPESWQPWDGLIVFKVRHILMGVFEAKTWRAQLLQVISPERLASMFPGYQPGQLLILPPGETYSGPLEESLEELQTGAAALNYLKESDLGSNSWVLSGSRTASGQPLLAGDSHRALDTPNVYYQNHLSCPDFDVVGFSMPGVPGFPHFGHNNWVAWCITHLSADYQDLYIERFKPSQPGQYLYRDQWLNAEVHEETIRVCGGEDVPLRVWVTHHGPIISGDPEKGTGLAFKYTATDGPKAWADTIPRMLTSRNCEELMESMREWVDPCNNFLTADVQGNIGYLSRGEIPIRSPANALLPVPGWTGEHEWHGNIPFEELPRSMNPEAGYFATANNRPIGEDYPYHIALDFAPGYRVERVTRALLAIEDADATDMARVHADRLSIPARNYIKFLKQVEPLGRNSVQARERLLHWSGQMDADQVEPTIYSSWRDVMLLEILRYNLGEKLAALASNPSDRGLSLFLGRLKGRIMDHMISGDVTLLPPGQTWPVLASQALATAVARLRGELGEDMEQWRWGRVHQARPTHTLSDAFPALAPILDPPPIPMSGDADTPLAGSYPPADFATVGGLSVARYAFDLADWNNCLWAVPLGSSGHPGSSHYYDQSETWRRVEMSPMLYDWEAILANQESEQVLKPG